MRKEYVAFDEGKKLIIESLKAFDEDLGARAELILNDDKRLNIALVEEGQTSMMQCRPAGTTMNDVIAADMYIPDFAGKYGPQFTRQDNPEDYAIIDFEYDGTPRSVIWLSHELGHAIADGIQRENGRNYRNYSLAEMEEQAYFVQHIVSRAVREKFDNVEVTNLGENVLTMSFDRAAQFTRARGTYETAALTDPSQRTPIVHAALDERSLA